MFNFSWSELALIGAVALVVIGPKDLPKALRTAGRWARKARTISREFQNSIEQMIREAELDEVKKEIEKASAIDLDHEFQKTIDPSGSLAEAMKPPEMPQIGGETSLHAPTVEGAAPPAAPATPMLAETPPAAPPEKAAAEPAHAPPPHAAFQPAPASPSAHRS